MMMMSYEEMCTLAALLKCFPLDEVIRIVRKMRPNLGAKDVSDMVAWGEKHWRITSKGVVMVASYSTSNMVESFFLLHRGKTPIQVSGEYLADLPAAEALALSELMASFTTPRGERVPALEECLCAFQDSLAAAGHSSGELDQLEADGWVDETSISDLQWVFGHPKFPGILVDWHVGHSPSVRRG